MEWPFSLVTGFVIAVIIAFYIKTSITMFDDVILIKRFGYHSMMIFAEKFKYN